MCLRIRGLVAAVAALVVLQSAGAAAVTIKASFAPIRVSARPGQLLTTTYELKLQEGEPGAHFKSWFRTGGARGRPAVVYAPRPDRSNRIVRPMGVLNPGEATGGGGESLQVRLTITVPDAVTTRGYLCALEWTKCRIRWRRHQTRRCAIPRVGLHRITSRRPIERGADVLALDVVAIGDRAPGEYRQHAAHG